MGARARRARRHGVARERQGAAGGSTAGGSTVRAGTRRSQLAQPAHRPGVPAGHLHHRLGGGRVRADRRGQRGTRAARRGPGHLYPAGHWVRPDAGAGPDPPGALRPTVGGKETAALADHAAHSARERPARPAGGGRRRPASAAPGAPGRVRRTAGYLRRLSARPRRPGRAAGQRRRGPRAWTGGDLRARRARGAGLRDPGGGERGVCPARGGGRSRGQRAGSGPRGRRTSRAGPAGTGPPRRRPGPGRAIRLGHRRTRLPRRARCRSGEGEAGWGQA